MRHILNWHKATSELKSLNCNVISKFYSLPLSIADTALFSPDSMIPIKITSEETLPGINVRLSDYIKIISNFKRGRSTIKKETSCIRNRSLCTDDPPLPQKKSVHRLKKLLLINLAPDYLSSRFIRRHVHI